MAVKKIATIQRYIGLAADTKPTGVPSGSTFLEYDTGLLYITYDNGVNWAIKKSFSGRVYENANTATDDTARRFETSAKKLRDVVIQVVTNAQLFGDSANQRYSVQAGETLGFTKVDISSFYFKNATAGQNGTVRILGVEE